MTETPNDDQPGFVAEEPEHFRACYRLIPPGQAYCLTVGQAILCEGCVGSADAIRVCDDLVVVVEDGRLLVRRGGSTVEVVLAENVHQFGDLPVRSSNSFGRLPRKRRTGDGWNGRDYPARTGKGDPWQLPEGGG